MEIDDFTSHVPTSRCGPIGEEPGPISGTTTTVIKTEERQDLPCNFCGQTFTKEAALGLHIKKHYYPFECSICARKIKTEEEVLRHEATHVEATGRPTTSPPTRNRDLVTLAPEKQPVVKNSFFDVQNPLLPQILDDAPKRAAHDNSWVSTPSGTRLMREEEEHACPFCSRSFPESSLQAHLDCCPAVPCLPS